MLVRLMRRPKPSKILNNVLSCMSDFPFSRREIYVFLVPIFSASSSCVRPARRRASLSVWARQNASASRSNSSRDAVPTLPYSTSNNSCRQVHPIKAFSLDLSIIYLFIVKIFFHQSLCPINFSRRSFLCLLLKTIKQDYQRTFVKATENPINISCVFNTYFIQSLFSFNTLKYGNRQPV